MKTVLLLLLSVVMCNITIHGQDKIPLIGQKAPSFTANSTNGEIRFPEDFGNNWKILFSHPRDFTPVCTSEVLQLARMQEEFNELGVKIALISTDDVSLHLKWKKSIEEIKVDGYDPVVINFPLIDDHKAVASRLYGMIHEDNNSVNVKDSRGVFIIDSENIIQSIFFYPMKVGRNFDEIKRTVEALQTVNTHVLTPANWEPGDDLLMRASPYLNPKLNNDEILKGYYNIGPIMWYKRTTEIN
ncbi:MAG: redoxin domain-containing protein [Prolixibacteraceae bacterium]|nr:redoxin domain-containing protein [Prolixibacteraceae bacterium]